MKLIFFCSLRARQSEVYITAKALAGSNFSPAVAPPWGGGVVNAINQYDATGCARLHTCHTLGQ